MMKDNSLLTITDQDITVNASDTISVNTANSLTETTSGVVTATIDPTDNDSNSRYFRPGYRRHQ